MVLEKIIEKILIIFTLVIVQACGTADKKKENFSGTDDKTDIMIEETSGEELPPATTVNGETLDSLDSAKIKVRNFTQFYSSYTALLEVPENDQNLTDFFVPIKTNLPTLTSAAGFLGSHQLALVKFGSKVCERSWDINATPEKRGKIFGFTSTSNALGEAFALANTTKLARTLISRFWGHDIDTIGAENEDVKTIIQLVTDSVNAMTEYDQENNQITINDATKIKYGIVGACTAVLTSAGSSFYGN